MEQDKQLSWSRRALDAAYAAERDAKTPQEAVAGLAAFAKEMARERARREAGGESPSLAAFASGPMSWAHETQMAKLMRLVAVNAADAGLAPSGEAWGAYKAFAGQVGSGALGDAIGEDSRVGWKSPAWRDGLDALRVELGIDKPQAPGVARAGNFPDHPASDFEGAFLLAVADLSFKAGHAGLASSERASTLSSPADAGPTDARLALAQTCQAAREISAMRAEREVATGVAWRKQELSTAGAQKLDAELLAMGRSIATLSQVGGVDPSRDAVLQATMRAISATMSLGGARQLADELARGAKIGAIGSGWKSVAKQLSADVDAGWGLGVPRKAATPSVARRLSMPMPWTGLAMDVAYPGPALVDLGSIGDAVPGEPGMKPMPPIPGKSFVQEIGEAAGRVAAGARAALRETAEAGRAASRWLDAKYSVAKGAIGEAKAKAVEAKQGALASAKARAAAAIDRGNAASDRAVEVAGAYAKAIAQTAKERSAEAASKTVEAAAGAAIAAREAFVGKVGEAKAATFQYAGSAALRAKDALPSADAIAHGGMEKQAKAVKAAAIGGALLMGVCAAPVLIHVAGVVGLAAAAYGGFKIGGGIAGDLDKGVGKARELLSKIPDALENFGARLGAKRSAAATADPAAPEPQAPSGPKA